LHSQSPLYQDNDACIHRPPPAVEFSRQTGIRVKKGKHGAPAAPRCAIATVQQPFNADLSVTRASGNSISMNPRHAAALLVLVGWYLLIPPVFSAMGEHPRAFNDLNAPLSRWDIPASSESNANCEKEKERIRNEAPLRLKFAHEHPDQDQNGNIAAVAEAWQRAECVATDDPRLNRN